MEEAVDREYEYRLEGDVELKRVRSSIPTSVSKFCALTISKDHESVLSQVQYEVCSQVLSQQPGAQLCRYGRREYGSIN